MAATWLLLQLADGTFPSGAFAHSSGLEAAAVLGGLPRRDGDAVAVFLEQSLRQIGRASLPFVRRTAAEPASLPEVDETYDATAPLVGPNHASRAQGRALASAVSRVWDLAAPIADHARRGPAHHAPVFGAIFGTLEIPERETLAAYVHGAARGILSAAVRLGLLGALEAQRLHAERASLFAEIVDRARDLPLENAAQTAPLIEMFAALHDRLDGRIFQS